MKKLLVALLALAMVVGVSAQTFSMGASGTVTLYDQDGMATFARDGSGYDLLTFKGADKDGKWGYSAVVDNFDAGVAPTFFRDWNAWYKLDFAKVIVGKIRNGDFRTALPNGWYTGFGATDRFFGGAAYGLVVESTTLGALTLGLGLPIGETAADSVDVFQTANLGVKYVVDKMLTAKALVRLDLVNNSNVVNFTLNYVGVENLDAYVLAKLVAASTTTTSAAVAAYYTMDALSAGLEFSMVNAAALTWDVGVNVGYTLNDNVSFYVRGMYDDASAYEVKANATYDFGNGLTAGLSAGYNSAVFYSLDVGYSVSF